MMISYANIIILMEEGRLTKQLRWHELQASKKHIRKHPPRSTERLYSPQYRHWWMVADLTGYGVWPCLLRWRHVLSWRDRCRAAVIHARVTAESVIKHVQSTHVRQSRLPTALRSSAMQVAFTGGGLYRPTGPERWNHEIKAKFHYDVLVADRSETGRRSAASWNLAS